MMTVFFLKFANDETVGRSLLRLDIVQYFSKLNHNAKSNPEI